ncbi:hypothetical protein [[Actinomadura] parvosata]|uniref:hypothetical protein n=1 Tax=[Actinomadura] parvosata TaxID=1955412 RepID=UPI0012BC4338|nr:hypothetical protein [Nonomuraea sp. ATCC 55076]
MRKSLPAVLMVVTLAGSACSSSPPPDTRPLGDVTAQPQECGLISRQAIARAIGLDDFLASGSRPGERFDRCIVSKPQSDEPGAELSISFDDPSALSLDELESTKQHDRGVDLPTGLGPGYTAQYEGKKGLSTYAYAWTPDARRRLSIYITPGAPGRDHRADAIEFVRQLKPILLTPSK